MNKKKRVKIVIDCIMTLMLPILMSYELIGRETHEWIGILMIILFIIHNIINLQWYKGLLRGKYTPVRILQICINMILLFIMLGLMFSGIILSQYVFDFIPNRGGASIARNIHMLGGYWGFVLMSFHLGMHWTVITAPLRKIKRGRLDSKLASILSKIGIIVILLYGAYALIKQKILLYMFLIESFVFFDFERPIALFFMEYIAIMGLLTFVGYRTMRSLINRGKKIRNAKENI